MMRIASYALETWLSPENSHGYMSSPVMSAVSGEQIGMLGGQHLQYDAMLEHARQVGGTALRALNFHDRARLLKALAIYLGEHKDGLYQLSHHSGATKADAMIDIDGGISTTHVFASKARRELPDGHVLLDGQLEMLSRGGSFVGQHIATPRLGVAVQINAFNFPVWGMLEKLSPAILAGVPVIVKAASSTSYIAEACVRLIIDSGILPPGSLQFIAGSSGNLLDKLDAQDIVSFTGSAATALKLRSNPNVLARSVRFIAEQDSLNATMLGQDVSIDAPEFTILVNEIVTEMTAKAGQKCTAIRRIICPADMMTPIAEAVTEKLASINIGDPALASTTMGALVSDKQKADVQSVIKVLKQETRVIHGDKTPTVNGADPNRGGFVSPTLLACDDPLNASLVHEREAFGPVATLMPYQSDEEACELLNRGGGSLVASLITNDPTIAKSVANATAAWHGRLYINNRESDSESTGHGSPLPHMLHGGPGRAGGGEELGGIRSVMHYLQRTAVQGSPRMIAAVGDTWIPGAPQSEIDIHPFRRNFNELVLGETLTTGPRRISIEDIEKFAHFTGDMFYAHMDEEAAAASPFFEGRVAHGYLLLAFAAGLFVEPSPGPVLANTGLESLQFMKPVAAGDSIQVRLTVKRKTRRTDSYGEVRWHVALNNQDDEPVAAYELHTMNSYA